MFCFEGTMLDLPCLRGAPSQWNIQEWWPSSLKELDSHSVGFSREWNSTLRSLGANFRHFEFCEFLLARDVYSLPLDFTGSSFLLLRRGERLRSQRQPSLQHAVGWIAGSRWREISAQKLPRQFRMKIKSANLFIFLGGNCRVLQNFFLPKFKKTGSFFFLVESFFFFFFREKLRSIWFLIG